MHNARIFLLRIDLQNVLHVLKLQPETYATPVNQRVVETLERAIATVTQWEADTSSKQPKVELDYNLIADVDVDGIDGRDAPDFSDAYIASATYMGRDMTEAELDVLNGDSQYVYECVEATLY